MKKNILNIAAAMSFVIALSIAGFAALSNTVTATVPFEFSAGKTQLPAGKYRISQGSFNGLLTIRNVDTNEAYVVMVRSEAGKESHAKLVFNRYGNQYFLSQIWDGYTDVKQLSKSKAERKAAKAHQDNLANNGQPEIVTISAQAGQ